MKDIPSQIYKPKNYDAELHKIKQLCSLVYNYTRERWVYVDEDKNIFDPDPAEGTISVN